MSIEWKRKALSELCTFKNGLWKGKKGPFRSVSVVRNTNFGLNGAIDLTDVAVVDVEERQFQSRELSRGDLILEKSGGGPKQPVGRVILFNLDADDFSFSNFTSRIRVNDVSEIDSEFLKYYLHFVYLSGGTETMQRHSTGIRNLSLEEYKQIIVTYPPLTEQRRIIALLDQAFAAIDQAIENTKKNIENAKELFDSYLNEVFTKKGEGWVEKQLPDLSENIDSRRVPITKKHRTAGPYPYYGASGVVDYVADFIFEGDNLLISEDGANLLARSTPIAFSVSGKYWVNNHAHILHFENIATQRFVEFYLESIKLDEFITGAAQPKLNQTALNSIPIPIPKTIASQAKIVGRIESIQKEIQRLTILTERKLAALLELKTSILCNLFT